MRKELGRRLKTARKAAGLTQYNVADLAGVSQPLVSLSEQGKRICAGEEMFKLMSIYQVDFCAFFEDLEDFE